MAVLFYKFPEINFIHIIDVLVVAYLIYKLMQLIQGTRAVQLIKGLVVLLVATTVSDWLGLYTINWILKNIRTMVVVAIPIVFQPELRRALEQLGRGKLFAKSLTFMEEEEAMLLIRELTRSVQLLAKDKIGALVVIEQQTGIQDYIETGIKIDALVSTEFLVNIFVPKTPLHDGAIIIRGDRVMAAGCFLPLSENPNLGKDLGTRHRAALGITEQSDAVALIVSEETGAISVAHDGKLTRYLDAKTLQELLVKLLIPKNNKQMSFWNWRSEV